MDNKPTNTSDLFTRSRTSPPPGPFAYQTRLLERTSSTKGVGSPLSRRNSQSGNGILNSPTGGSQRRWTNHRLGQSLDMVRGKWEDRIKDESMEESNATPAKDNIHPRSHTPDNSGPSDLVTISPTSGQRPGSASPKPEFVIEAEKRALKRRTLPATINAYPLSPNTTGISVEAPLSFRDGHASTRIHIPSPFTDSSFISTSSENPPPLDTPQPSSRVRRSNTMETPIRPTFVSTSPSYAITSASHTTAPPTSTPRRRPNSLYGVPQSPYVTEKFMQRPSSSNLSLSLSGSVEDLTNSSQTPSSLTSVMSPRPYRSSYMTNKKASTYLSNIGGSRKIGHLPRIASGDVDVGRESDQAESERTPGGDRDQDRRIYDRQAESAFPVDSHLRQDLVPDAEDVAGLPGRPQLKAPSAPNSPLPAARFGYSIWADIQRHLLQAYEYLCHVGEAKEWIEGCLDEKLGFGIVDMEEGLRNGVILAKLVRAFQGEAAVRRIYEAPKLDFRHSDNINHFFEFVRGVGLPEGFIFELTDLYEKKNIPKVIYCIHALSHLLARRGMAQRIGNLLGRLHFSDDQLTKTQKGLNDSGVTMPNFGSVGRELAKEINEEPEPEIETEEERRDRLLLDSEASIIAVQAFCRGAIARQSHVNLLNRIGYGQRYIPAIQSVCRGILLRRQLRRLRSSTESITPWIIKLQATCRRILLQRHWLPYVRCIRGSILPFMKIQAQVRGVIQRRRFRRLKTALRKSRTSIIELQATARARLLQKRHMELAKSFTRPIIGASIVRLQAQSRGSLSRLASSRFRDLINCHEPTYVKLQAQCRRVLVQMELHSRLAKLDNIANLVVRTQAAARTYLARKRLLTLIRGLRKATAIVVDFQARARATLTRRERRDMNKVFTEVKTVNTVIILQARARATIARKRHRQLYRQIEFTVPDVIGLQSAIRGMLIRRDFIAWKDHLQRSHGVASYLQAMFRGALVRRTFRQKMEYYKANLSQVVKIQSLFRAKETREQYRQLTLGKNVTVSTIKNFVHLLDDSEADFQEEIKVERLRKRVVESIRENQALENDVNDLDVKIALVVQNAKSFDDLIKAKRRHGGDSAAAHAARMSLLAAHGDPFSGPNTLDQRARRKLELYQQLFYLLQSRGEYLSRLLILLSSDRASEKSRRFVERVVLTLFGYGQDRREDYLLLKLFQLAIREEMSAAARITDVIHGHPMYINIAVHYVRPKQNVYVREAFQSLIQEVIGSDDLDLEVDPTIIYKARVELEEMRSGIPTQQPKEISFRDATRDVSTRPVFIRHLQVLQWWTETFVAAMKQSTRKMPYNMRYLARETLVQLREKFPDASDAACAACVGRLVYYRYVNPAIVTPETFDIVSKTIDVPARKNLAQISRVLTQITSGTVFGDDHPMYVPINDYVNKAISEISAWMLEIADVPDLESYFHAHEFLDVTVQPKPIYISPNEIYTIHGLFSQYQDQIASDPNDTLRVILAELDGVPNLSEELKDARDQAITLELTNRFADVRDPHAEEKTLWVQAKRGVLAILRVQPAQDLLQSLMQPVTDVDERVWEDILDAELESEQARHPRRQPSTAATDAYRLEDIRSLKFAAVKALAISNLLELEKQGKIARNDGFQGILNAIAGDVRSKHRKRLQRQQEMESMNEALKHLAERKKYFEEQINSYHNYVEMAMNTMQRGKGKKRFVLPFTKQYFHLRDLQRSGQTPQFGSYLYTAKYLYDKGILLSIDHYSPRQFDKIQLTISSDTAGVFKLVLESTMLGVTSRIASEDVRMEDLLQAKYENRPSYSLFDGKVKVNFERFLYQINKKFYV